MLLKKNLNLPLELWTSCRSGLGAKSDPIPDDPLDDITPCLVEFGFSPPTIQVFLHLKKKKKKKLLKFIRFLRIINFRGFMQFAFRFSLFIKTFPKELISRLNFSVLFSNVVNF